MWLGGTANCIQCSILSQAWARAGAGVRDGARARARVGLVVWAMGIGCDDVCGPLPTDPSLLLAISA